MQVLSYLHYGTLRGRDGESIPLAFVRLRNRSEKSNIHSDAETGREPYVAGCSSGKDLCDTVRINAMVFSSIELPSRLLAVIFSNKWLSPFHREFTTIAQNNPLLERLLRWAMIVL